MYIFKGTLDNLEYLGKLGTHKIPKTVTYTVNSLTDEDIKKIKDGYKVSIKKGELSLIDDKEIEKQKKKIKCREKIEEKYKEHDQINILMSGTPGEIESMKSYINNCLNEYRTNGKDADFSKIK